MEFLQTKIRCPNYLKVQISVETCRNSLISLCLQKDFFNLGSLLSVVFVLKSVIVSSSINYFSITFSNAFEIASFPNCFLSSVWLFKTTVAHKAFHSYAINCKIATCSMLHNGTSTNNASIVGFVCFNNEVSSNFITFLFICSVDSIINCQ